MNKNNKIGNYYGKSIMSLLELTGYVDCVLVWSGIAYKWGIYDKTEKELPTKIHSFEQNHSKLLLA